MMLILNFNSIKAVNKINVLKNETNKLDTNEKDKRDFMKKQFVEHKKLWETVSQLMRNL